MIGYETYTIGERDQILVMEVEGRLDTEASQYLLDCVQAQIDRGMHDIILDCSNLEYISSMGLGTLVRANSRLRALSGSVALVQVPGLVADVIGIARLDKLLHIFSTVEEAADSFKSN